MKKLLEKLFKTDAQKEAECIAEMDNNPINKVACPICENTWCWIKWTGDDDYKIRNGCKFGDRALEKELKEIQKQYTIKS